MSGDKKELCGVFGIWGHGEAANLAYLGLYGQQHRGQESAGITSTDGRQLYTHRAMGLVADIFSREHLEKLPGSAAIGHVRYATSGHSDLQSAQPIPVGCWRGQVAVAHNGNLVNAVELRKHLERRGAIFAGSSDSEVFVHLMAKNSDPSWETALIATLSQVRGAYSLVVLTPQQLLAVRDPLGYRPLILGDLDGSPIVCSESCALNLIGARFVREVLPGELLVIDDRGVTSRRPFVEHTSAHCIFEFIYFARPDSFMFGESVHRVRRSLGRELAIEAPAEADMVVPVPDSGVWAAMGYAAESGIPFEMGLIRNHYVGRTFIEPESSIRDFGVKIKLNPVREVIGGKRLVVIDDSIVRGTTSRKLVRLLKSAGAAEVHLRISAPPTRWPCYYGIDIPTRSELIAARLSVDEIRAYIGADSLGYLSLEGLMKCVHPREHHFCKACFDGAYRQEGEPAADERHREASGAARAASRESDLMAPVRT
ncbi:MAG: amidophosphoribosyltransferase [Candidatus Schekmanbacteria bacterium]|nr:amidophosphoribosyltransferase [Candidatus Schekmanbacteria bacterium]